MVTTRTLPDSRFSTFPKSFSGRDTGPKLKPPVRKMCTIEAPESFTSTQLSIWKVRHHNGPFSEPYKKSRVQRFDVT